MNNKRYLKIDIQRRYYSIYQRFQLGLYNKILSTVTHNFDNNMFVHIASKKQLRRTQILC